MSTEHVAAVLDHSRKGGSHLVILLVIAAYSDPRGEWITHQATLQKRARLSRRRIRQLLEDLVATGELDVVPGNGRGNLSTYRLKIGGLAPEKAKPSPRLPEKGGAERALPAQQGAAERPLPRPQSAVFRVNLLLEEAGVYPPSPAQIGLWSKTLGGIEPLLELLGRLIHAGLATKRQPLAYVHRVVMERAARLEPARPAPLRPAHPMDLLRSAGVDDIRRAQAARIMAGTSGKRNDR